MCTLRERCLLLGLSPQGINGRLQNGWNLYDALSVPKIKNPIEKAQKARTKYIVNGVSVHSKFNSKDYTAFVALIRKGYSINGAFKEVLHRPKRTLWKGKPISHWFNAKDAHTVSDRIRRGWSVEIACTTPILVRKSFGKEYYRDICYDNL